jgi:hypothetical protein
VLDALRAKARKARRWPVSMLQAVYRRRYQLQHTGIECFLTNGRNFFLSFASQAERNRCLKKMVALAPPQLISMCSRAP